MSRDRVIARAALAALCSALVVGAAPAGSVSGVVRDDGRKAPNNGLKGAEVWAEDKTGKKVSGPVGTFEKGEYRLPDLPEGTYTIVVSKVGCQPTRCRTVKVTVSGGEKQADDSLLYCPPPPDGMAAYFGVVSENVLARVGDSDRKVRLTAEWRRLQEADLPTSSRAIIGKSLVDKATWVVEAVPDIRLFAEAQPKLLGDVEREFLYAAESRKVLPMPGQVKSERIRPELIADVALYTAKTSRLTAGEKNKLLEDFRSNWKDPAVSDKFLDFQKQGLLDNRGHLLNPI